MKQKQKTISRNIKDTSTQVDSLMSSITQFQSRLSKYEEKVKYGEDALPRLKQSIEEIESGLPEWRDKIRVLRLSIKTHRKRFLENTDKLTLLEKKCKLTLELKEIENELLTETKNASSN